MKPVVKSAQKLPPGIPWIVYPESKCGVNLLNNTFRLFASKAVQSLICVFFGNAKKANKKLPEYTPDGSNA